MTSARLVAVGLSVLWLAACGKDDGKDNNNNNPQPNGPGTAKLRDKLDLDFADVKGFVVAKADSSSSGLLDDSGNSNTTTQKLYSIGADGTLTEVTVTETTNDTEDGSETQTSTSTQTFNPKGVTDTPKLVFFRYENLVVEQKNCYMVGVRKSDGGIFCLDTQLSNSCNNGYESRIAPIRDDNVVLMETEMQGLLRLDFNDAPPTSTKIVDPDTDGRACGMVTNDSDDAMMSVANKDNTARTVRVYKDAGGFTNLFAGDGLCMIQGPASEPDVFYYTRVNNQVNFDYELVKVSKGASGDYEESIAAASLDGTDGDFPCSDVVRTADKIFSVHTPGGNDAGLSAYFVELVNAEATPKKHDVEGLKRVDRIYGYDAGLVILGTDNAGNTALKRFLFADETFQDIVQPGEYVITNVSVIASGALTFAGRRASDNARILGSVAAGSNDVTVDATSLKGDVQELIRLN